MSASGPEPATAYVEHCLPAPTPEGRLGLALEHGLALEVANRPEAKFDIWADTTVPVATVQAYGMHEAHPLHPDPQRVRAARRHVRDTIEKATAIGARRVLTVCGFGHEPCDRPFERCVDFFAGVASFAREHGVLVLIEKLSRRRAGAMTGAEELARLFDELDAPDVFRAALDTGHILDDGLDPAGYFKAWRHPVEEIQLRGPNSAPPAPGEPLRDWLGALPALPAVVCVEHTEAIDRDRLTELVRSLRRELARAR